MPQVVVQVVAACSRGVESSSREDGLLVCMRWERSLFFSSSVCFSGARFCEHSLSSDEGTNWLPLRCIFPPPARLMSNNGLNGAAVILVAVHVTDVFFSTPLQSIVDV